LAFFCVKLSNKTLAPVVGEECFGASIVMAYEALTVLWLSRANSNGVRGWYAGLNSWMISTYLLPM
jgi:hypothetical protein